MASDTYTDRNAVFRKLRAKSENKVKFCFLMSRAMIFLGGNAEIWFRSDPFFHLLLFLWGVCDLNPDLDIRICISDVFRLQREESDLGVCYVWDLPVHWLFGGSSKPWRAYQFREVDSYLRLGFHWSFSLWNHLFFIKSDIVMNCLYLGIFVSQS